MTWETADLEAFSGLVNTTKRGVGMEVKEPVSRRGYSLWVFVIQPAMAVCFLVFFGVFGVFWSVYAAGNIWLGWDDTRMIAIVIGLPMAFACYVTYKRFVSMLEEWRKLQWRRKDLYAEPGDDAARESAQIERTTPDHLIGLRAPWVSGWQTLLANRVFNRKGEWTGGKSIARDRHLAGLYTALTKNFKTALDDLQRLGWLRDKEWTDKAKEELEVRLPVASPTPNRGS